MLALEEIGSRHSVYLLVLIGWRMPRLNGFELGLELSKIDPRIKIILFSALFGQMANDYLDAITRTFNVKFDHFYMAVSTAELLEMINNKIKYGDIKEDDVMRRSMRRYRLRKLSPDWYFRVLLYRIRRHKRNN